MQTTKYLIIGLKNKYAKPSFRLTSQLPALKSHEISMKLILNIPDELFSKPQLQTTISVPADAISTPVIDTKVMDNIQEIIQQQLGVDLQISLVESVSDE